MAEHLNLRTVQQHLAPVGVSVSRANGEYLVRVNGGEACDTYVTDDLEDAHFMGLKLARAAFNRANGGLRHVQSRAA